MGCKVILDTQSGIIYTRYTDTVSKQDILTATSKVSSLVEGEGPHRFLIDFVDVTLKLKITEILGFPDQWDELGFSRRNKLAIVVTDQKMLEQAKLYVANCRRRGWRVDRFSCHQTAIDWLLC